MDISVKDLQEAISIRQQIDNLHRRLSSLLRGAPQRPTGPTARGRYFSPATRAKLAAAAKARWARTRGMGGAAPARRKGQLTPAGRRKLSAADESSLGGKKESRRNEKGFSSEERHTYACRPKETLRVDEGALGSEKKGRRKIATVIVPSSCWCDFEDPWAARVTARERSRTSTGFPIRS